MRKEIINWLLEEPKWLKYAVEKHILQNTSNPLPEIKDPEIQALIKILKSSDKGFNTILKGTASYLKESFWYLFFLSDKKDKADGLLF